MLRSSDHHVARPDIGVVALCLTAGALVLLAQGASARLATTQTPAPRTAADDGFTDTPMLPGLPWHVHDPARPHPPW